MENQSILWSTGNEIVPKANSLRSSYSKTILDKHIGWWSIKTVHMGGGKTMLRSQIGLNLVLLCNVKHEFFWFWKLKDFERAISNGSYQTLNHSYDNKTIQSLRPNNGLQCLLWRFGWRIGSSAKPAEKTQGGAQWGVLYPQKSQSARTYLNGLSFHKELQV